MTILAVIFILLGVFYFLFLIRFAYGFSILKNENSNQGILSISAIVPVRNEEKNISACLASLLNQNYPKEKFDIHVVDDSSTDSTIEIVKSFQQKYSNLFLHSLDERKGFLFKKRAIQIGIQNSKGEIIVTTDGDCVMNPNWLSTLTKYFDNETGLISAPVELIGDGSFFQLFQVLEFLGLITIGAGAIAINSPNMCNGANLAYHRKAFKEVNGFTGIDGIASGDDELLMHKIHRSGKWKIKFAKEKDAIVRTAAQKNTSSFLEQRKRWASKSLHYENFSLKISLLIVYLFFLSLVCSFIFSLTNLTFARVFLIQMMLKVFSEFVILFLGARFFEKRKLFAWFLPYQLIHIPYIIWAGINGTFGGSYQWKERKTK